MAFVLLFLLAGSVRQADARGAAAAPRAVAAAAGAADSLRRFVGNIGAFNSLFPQEKVYLHFDNTAYFRGETIWFSAYVVRADRQQLSDMSRVLYVELLDPTGEVVEERKLRLADGRGSGSIKLDRLLTSGFYEVRAYTRYMLNWDTSWAFSRVLPVFNSPGRAGDYSRAEIAAPVWRKRLPSSREGDTLSAKAVNVSFHPEGGRLVQGLPSRVAFSVTDGDGRPMDCAGHLTLADGTTLTFDGGGNQNPPKYYDNGTNIRMYPKNSLKINSTQTIVGIEMECDTYNNIICNASGDVTTSSGKISANGNILTVTDASTSELTLTNVSTQTSTPSQIRFLSLKIYYAE